MFYKKLVSLSSGQKPFPCPRCDAFFSTKSNCERHLLRKHGVTHRTLRRNGALGRKEGDEASHESAGQFFVSPDRFLVF